jgi:phage shock protein E
MDPTWLNHMLLAAALTAGLYGSWRWLSGVASASPGDERLTQALVDRAQLLDVRTRTEFSGDHLSGARNIPLGELATRMGELGGKDRPLLVYCLSGSRSRSAVRQLEAGGFETVIDLGSSRGARAALEQLHVPAGATSRAAARR